MGSALLEGPDTEDGGRTGQNSKVPNALDWPGPGDDRARCLYLPRHGPLRRGPPRGPGICYQVQVGVCALQGHNTTTRNGFVDGPPTNPTRLGLTYLCAPSNFSFPWNCVYLHVFAKNVKNGFHNVPKNDPKAIPNVDQQRPQNLPQEGPGAESCFARTSGIHFGHKF